MVRVSLRIPQRYVSRATYALEMLALAWGLPIRIETGGDASDIVYGIRGDASARRLPNNAVFVPFDASLYDPATVCAAVELDGRPAWCPTGSDTATVDFVGSTYRVLTLLDESQIAESDRDRRGTFSCAALPSGRLAATGMPLVEHHADALLELLLCRNAGLSSAREPRWPNGKRWAAVLTHDTDAVRIGAPAEIATNFAKAILRRDGVSLEMVRLGLKYGREVSGNPLFGFPVWRDWERARGVRSAFYLFVLPPGTRRDINDCKSSVLDPGTDWTLLRETANEGWEFGLHAPIHAKDDVETFVRCKQTLEEHLEQPILGLRHHYWALDWRAPWRTHRQHIQAGFQYDTSIAWRDRPGFRAGTALPFRPFDPERSAPLELDVLPSSIMDDQVISNPLVGPTFEAATTLLDAVRNVGGIVVFNWHTEAASNRLRTPGFVDRLTEIYEGIERDSTCWRPTPLELVQHWRRRRIRLCNEAQTPIHVTSVSAVH